MFSLDVDETVEVLNTVLDALSITVNGNVTRETSDFNRALGALRALGEGYIYEASIAQPLCDCFNLAREAGASFNTFNHVRNALVVLTPSALIAGGLRDIAVYFVLTQQAKIITNTEFKSRQDVEASAAIIHASFEAAQDKLSEANDNAIFRMLLTLHASVTRFLSENARPLPQMTKFDFSASYPAAVLANRIYGDASRFEELLAENKTRHPLFMANSGRALSE